MEHTGMAPRLQVTDPAESIRKKRAPLDLDSGATGGGRGEGEVSHGRHGFFHLEKKSIEAPAWPSINGEWVTSCSIWTSFFEPFVLHIYIPLREGWILILRRSGWRTSDAAI